MKFLWRLCCELGLYDFGTRMFHRPLREHPR